MNFDKLNSIKQTESNKPVSDYVGNYFDNFQKYRIVVKCMDELLDATINYESADERATILYHEMHPFLDFLYEIQPLPLSQADNVKLFNHRKFTSILTSFTRAWEANNSLDEHPTDLKTMQQQLLHRMSKFYEYEDVLVQEKKQVERRYYTHLAFNVEGYGK